MPTKAQTEQRKKALIPIKKGQLSKDELKKRQVNGGKKSALVRKEKKLFKDEILKKMSEKDWDEMILNLIERAKFKQSDFETLRDTIGQKPVQEVNLVSDAEDFTFVYKYSKNENSTNKS